MEGPNTIADPGEGPPSNDSSLTLSLTPPKDDTSTISEHLSSIENDRSMQELEVVSGRNFALLLQDLPQDEERISQEPKPHSINSSFNGSSIISLNGLDKFINANVEGRVNAVSILDEILSNEQFKSDSESKDDSFNIFANVDLDDTILNGYNLGRSANFNLGSVKNDSTDGYDEVCKQVRDLEELVMVKESTIAALTSELDSFREIISNTSSFGTSTTDYKQYEEECHRKLVEYHDALTHKDEQIEKLTTSLQQSILNREEMKQHLKNEIGQLQEQLKETSALFKQHKFGQRTELDYDESCAAFQKALDPHQIGLFAELKMALNGRVEAKRMELEKELNDLKGKLSSDKLEHDEEIARMKETLEKSSVSVDVLQLKKELDEKHSKEMEELRTYFEKKCADLEKNYSEEIFSQQSRKMSDSTCDSDSEMSSDFVFAQPGPGGDVKVEYTKKDLQKMRHTLSQLVDFLNRNDPNNMSDEEFEQLKFEIGKFDVKNLIKFDLNSMRCELQNKYHAELEILREDFDNRVDVMNVENAEKLRNLEKRYAEEVEDLNTQLRGRVVSTAVQEVANSGEFEIDEVIQSYERRLQEQVTLAKIDLIAALEGQIQRLVASDNLDDDWPEELLQLKNRFAEKNSQEIECLRRKHADEVAALKEEHGRSLERARRRSLRDADSLSRGEMELLRERDALKKQTLSLRNLLGELLKYFTECEDELNNTLVEELVAKKLEKELDASSKRVHITPNFDDFLNLIDSSPDNDLDSIDLKSELGSCLQKLKSDANAILSLSTTFRNQDDESVIGGSNEDCILVQPKSAVLEQEVSSLTRKLITETQLKNELMEQLSEAKSVAKSLEADRDNLESQLEQVLDRQKVVESDLGKAREKIAELIESGHREVVSEGYGEDGDKTLRGLVEAVASLKELQEKARGLMENRTSLEPKFVHLVEELMRVGEKIAEESRKERDDLHKQIEAADKKYRVTCQFLEEQATEREQERDDSQKEIDTLREQLKAREKDRVSCERITNEAENLERQLRDMSASLDASERRRKEVENERKEAVDKVYELREIIRDLEDQVKVKVAGEVELRNIVDELETIVRHQAGRPAVQDVSDVEHLQRYVGELEGEVQRLRLSSEIAGGEGAIRQIKNHLSDFETTLDKRTKDLEVLHSTVSTTCSSPSEDMSIRDVVQEERSVFDECEVPLQQLARLKEKLIRHSRAEDAAVKRIRDLEMLILALKRDLEESQNEREILKRQISDHLVLISNLQIRLDEQRIRAEHIEKQTNTSLEVQNYDLKNTIGSLEEKIAKRDRTIAQLKANIEDTMKRLQDRENELSENKEDDLLVQMQEEVELLRAENLKLKSKMKKEAQILPNLMENIISDKNNDIELLKERLSETEKQLEVLSSLDLNKEEIESLNRLRRSGMSLSDLEDLEQVRRSMKGDTSLTSSVLPTRKNDDTPEISSIEKIGPPNVFLSLQVPHHRANSTEKHVRFVDEIAEGELTKLKKEVAEKDLVVQDYETRLQRLKDLEVKVEQLQRALEETETTLQKATTAFEEELKNNQDQIQQVHLELTTKRRELEQKAGEMEEYRRRSEKERQDGVVRNQVIKRMEKIQAELVRNLDVKEQELRSHEETLKVQNEELKKLQQELQEGKTKSEDFAKEALHLQHLLVEKEKIIDQMGADSRTLQVNLESIQSKLQESGNVVDLGRRLREEQKKNCDLYEELHGLKAQLLSVDRKSVDDIAGQVQRELEYSAYLDSTLINAVSDGSLEDVEALKLALRKQKSSNKQLTKAKELTDRKLEEAERKYQEIKKDMDTVQYEDAILIGELRGKLDQALDSQLEFDKIMNAEKNNRTHLEHQLRSMKEKVSTLSVKANSLPDLDHQKREWGTMMGFLEGENTDLKSKIDASKRDLVSKDEAIQKLEAKVLGMMHQEQAMKEKLSKMKGELEAKSKEVVATKTQLDEFDNDRRRLMRQLEQKPKSTDAVPDRLMEKIRELNSAVKDNVKMVDLISRLTNEKAVLEERIAAWEDPRDMPFDSASRANYLFARYLRSESYRKALTWQKRYLISLLETYQYDGRLSTLQLPNDAHHPPKRVKFKQVALMVVAVCRMKYLVRRWHSGKRIAQQRSVEQKAQFHVGQPVSSQNFAPKEAKSALNQAKGEMSWFGTSPPSKDRERTPSKRASAKVLPPRIPEQPPKLCSDSRLSSPAMLSKYFERFNSIQNRLGLDHTP